jgi:hypothetical protein
LYQKNNKKSLKKWALQTYSLLKTNIERITHSKNFTAIKVSQVKKNKILKIFKNFTFPEIWG